MHYSIPARKSDAVETSDLGVQSLLKQKKISEDCLVSDDVGSGLLVLPRAVRVSLTFRKTLCAPCHCGENCLSRYYIMFTDILILKFVQGFKNTVTGQRHKHYMVYSIYSTLTMEEQEFILDLSFAT